MPTALIMGASRGLGVEFARQYADEGWRIIGTYRDASGKKALKEVPGVETRQLDVTDHAAIEDLARSLKNDPIDLLLNVAGIYGPRPALLGGIDYDAWEEVFRVNTMAPLKICASFVDHVARSERKQIVTVSSIMGSMGSNDVGGAYIYRSSKAAVNAVMKSLAVDVEPRGVTVVVLHPGWVRTDMGGPGADIDPADSVTGMRQVIGGLSPADNGRFFNYDGSPLPW
jgi:NAD(P)-dependent dehydrogenase (short-subunit alcohol dehydrogenase family)